MSVMGLDIGTTGCKTIVFADDGRILAQARREYGIQSPRPGWAEQDAEQIWQLALETLREAIAGAAGDEPVALALSCQGEAVAPVDADGRALRPMILGMDTRTTAENGRLEADFGGDLLFQRTGMPVHTINTLPKLLWLQSNEAGIWSAAHQFLLYEDFFLRRLGGEAVISGCIASRTQMMDLQTGAWDNDILARYAIDPQRLARVAPADGAAVGQMTPELTRTLGLRRAPLLASGGHDQACAALGSGVVAPGLAMVSTGTAEVVEVALAAPTVGAPLQHAGISVYRHVVPGLFLAMTLNHSGGILLRWLRDTMGRWQVEQGRTLGVDAYDLLLDGAPAGPSGLLVLPHFAGSGTPTLDTASRGAIIGLTTSTTLAALTKAVLEGLTFELRQNLDLLRANGVAIDELRAVGGGARSPLWLQLKADICDVNLRTLESSEAACLGAAMLAGRAAGVYGSLAEAADAVVKLADRVTPEAASRAAYERWYRHYETL
ncbi:MAG: FGGY-family carbohydrate kinase, partial [Caldilineaceae bacterium]